MLKVICLLQCLNLCHCNVYSNLMCRISMVYNLHKSAFWTYQIIGIIKIVVRDQKICQQPGRTIDIVIAMVEMIWNTYMSSKEHETNSTKKHNHNSQEASSIVLEPNRKKLLGRCVKDLCPYRHKLMRYGQHMTRRFAASSIIYAFVRLHTILQLCSIFIFIHIISDLEDLELDM